MAKGCIFSLRNGGMGVKDIFPGSGGKVPENINLAKHGLQFLA